MSMSAAAVYLIISVFIPKLLVLYQTDSDYVCIMRETLSGYWWYVFLWHQTRSVITVFLLRDKVILPTKWWALFPWIILSFIILILVTTTFKSRPRTNLRRLFCFIEIVEISHFIANNVSVKSNGLWGRDSQTPQTLRSSQDIPPRNTTHHHHHHHHVSRVCYYHCVQCGTVHYKYILVSLPRVSCGYIWAESVSSRW